MRLRAVRRHRAFVPGYRKAPGTFWEASRKAFPGAACLERPSELFLGRPSSPAPPPHFPPPCLPPPGEGLKQTDAHVRAHALPRARAHTRTTRRPLLGRTHAVRTFSYGSSLLGPGCFRCRRLKRGTTMDPAGGGARPKRGVARRSDRERALGVRATVSHSCFWGGIFKLCIV